MMPFVLSALITSVLILGVPVTLYLEGRKKEAYEFLGFEICWLFIVTAIILVIGFQMR